ncbi:phosphoglucosamine mutase [Loktanella salsilacus]|jgi:phosphoglucosamine mutase|uniref:Phosphoglucosamine mutase n=1 Tax=Loktanella salsilacus TaxID=195913 RepID=A0A1I4JIG9_9RHOB|nr:phosphoglucosamine mutase [Loktanella salsilacus]SFL66360.1 phosphoglucosamine mutase [Loktanella salsilacus]
MHTKIFGTDGVRGRANRWPMTADMALRLGQIAGLHFTRSKRRHTVVIGKDTRLSGYMLEHALVAGFTAAGMDVILTGPLPTPGVGMLTRSMRADAGVMISASHNPHWDNGIKFFGPDGFKLSDADEEAIEAGLRMNAPMAEPAHIGRAMRIDGAVDRYIEFAKHTFPRDMRLDGMKIVVDAANGAAHRAAPRLIWELGAEVIEIGTTPNGTNINEDCGSTAPRAACEAVVAHGADLGIALDGDADRVHMIDETGKVVDGDQIMAVIATEAKRRDALRRDTLVATVMSNMGLARHLAANNIALERTQVGDRHVVERMRALGCNVGGEQSGHIIMSDHVTTGDGLIAALQVLAAIRRMDDAASVAMNRFKPMPQVLRNVQVAAGAQPLEMEAVQKLIASAGARLGDTGRILVRPSGTEPVIRVMAEGEDEALLHSMTEEIGDAMARTQPAHAVGVHTLFKSLSA